MAIGIALVGSGIFATEEHLPAIQDTPSLSLKAIYSRSKKSAQTLSEKAPGVELYSDDSEGKTYDDLLKRDDIQGVLIALPINAQPEYIKKALSAGKHVLAEKPVAKDISTAKDLISWTSDPSNTRAVYSVAENFRFHSSLDYACSQIRQLGRVLSFRVRVASFAAQSNKYYQTAWRKVPEYQGGFILDGGVHSVAAMRLLVGATGEKVKRLSAFTTQTQEHLPPVDSLNAALQLTNHVTGTLSILVGTTDSGSEYLVACEKGTVLVTRGKVTVTKDGKSEEKEFKDEGSGVKPEVKAWAKAMEGGKRDERQSPEEALGDLEIIEAALMSGDKGGSPITLKFQ